MPRTRRSKPELTESWDDVPEHEASWTDDDDAPYEEEEDRQRRRDVRGSRGNISNGQDGPRKRITRASVEPELIMPSSPNTTNGKARTNTPHLRMNERSMTSGAGGLGIIRSKARAQTPRSQTLRSRMNQRSMTSDAGMSTRRTSSLRGETNEEMDDSLTSYAILTWNYIIGPIVAYVGEVVGLVLNNAKPILAWALFAYLIVAAAVFLSNFLTNSINSALSPICRIPGVITIFNPPFCPRYSPAPEIAGPAEFDKLVQAQSEFNEVLSASSAGVSLPLEMKKSEAGIRDLKHVVQYSSLPSRNELVYEFSGFIETARQASQDLGKFNSHIGRAVDKILSTNHWTLKVIDGVSASEVGHGTISKFFSDYLNVFAPFRPISLSRDVLLDQYLRHTSEVEDQILALISEAQALLNILENLDGRLDVIAGIATRDGLKAAENRDELFADLWTKLGGNRSSVKKLQNQMDLLKNVGQYRKIAWAHVTSTIVKLQAIRDNLEDLRERVAMPDIVGTKKVPLEVHIDAINLGIQRLEEQRDSSRRSEAESYQRVIARAEAGDANLIAG